MNSPELQFIPASPDDFEDLLALRITAMRDSLEQIGRFDPARARARFVAGFTADDTQHIYVDQQRVGFFVVKKKEEKYLLDHFYIHPDFQGRGIGTAVLQHVFDITAGYDLHVGALRSSSSNRFYQRHGFEQIGEEEWDIYYVRKYERNYKSD